MRFLPLLLLTLTAIASPAAERVLSPKDVANLRSVTSAAISPDGNSVAYTLSVQRELFAEDNGPAWVELHVWNAGQGSRAFVTGQVNVSAVSWTPDGKSIGFLAKRGNDKARSLYVIPVDGGEARKVLDHETDISRYHWLGDGNNVAFTANEKKNADTEELKKKGFNQEIFEEELTYARVWVADLSKAAPETKMLELEGNANDLVAAPAGDLLALGLAPRPLVDDGYMYTRVYIVRISDGELVHKIENPGKLGMIRWSPDGNNVAMMAGATENDPNAGRLFLTNMKSRETAKHFLEDEGDVAYIAWKDDNTLLYLWDEGVDTELREMNVGTGETKRLLEQAYPSVSYSKESGKMAFVGSTPRHPSELFVWNPGESDAKRATNSNSWLDDVSLAKQEVVEWDTRDGLKLQGLLIRPLNEVRGKRYPLIMYVHGGPEAHQRNGWLTSYSMPGQVSAARGFAVFYPNYRASTGRGVDFSMLDHGRPAMEEFDDLVDGVKHLVSTGLVDEQRVGVTGGSYGGYATAWCSTALTEHFAAGVMFVGISDKISKLGTSDIPDEVYLVHDRHRLWDDWELFLKQSPIYHVQQAKTPLLILHGKDDPRVPPSQSLELYRNLKVVGKVPVRLVWYPGEGHGNRKAAARYDYNVRALRWMEHYLQGPGGDMPDRNLDYGFDDKK
jgi:dipeptidyl aminopeptidase/acylaminoacyl peptidase